MERFGGVTVQLVCFASRGTIGHLCPAQEGGDAISRETKASHLIG